MNNALDTRLIQLHNGSKGLRAELPVDVKPDPTDADILHMRASDETLDRYQEVIVASGWRLENYLKNPVIQNAHQYGDIIFTIGQALKTWVSGKDLLQTWKFASRENPFAKIARDLYRGGYLRAASVGFVPIRWEDGKEKSGFKRRYLEQELLEVSAVGIPANPNALALAVKDGAVEKSDLQELSVVLRHLESKADTPVRGGQKCRPYVKFCNDQAGLPAAARAPGRETNGAQWLQLAREVRELADRA
ncbi:MAG TPA: HK97 family phage prohead protease [Verrucomicrobiae bacterium]|nr:HK97 family phage prohead protease [Verrucomicrobiae bacterium]